MLVNLKKIVPLAVICLFPLALSAKVTPVTEYNGKGIKSSSDELTVNCAMYGYYESPQYNADCTQKKLIDGTKCWYCVCNTSTYQFTASQCNSTGFIPGGARCTVGDTNLYSQCDCNPAGNYLSSSLYVSNVTSAFTYSGTTATVKGSAGKTLTCYQYDRFTCKSGSKLSTSQVSGISGSASAVKFTAKDDSPYLTYTAKSTLSSVSDSKTTFCTSAVSPSSPLTSSVPTGNDCAEYSSANAKYYNNQLYYFFNGNCSNSGKCTNTNVGTDCAIFGGNAVATYNSSSKTSGSVTCKYTTGCDVNVLTNSSGTKYMCAGVASSTPVNGSYFAYTDMSAGSVSCRKITACTSPYTLAQMSYGQTLTSTDTYKTDSSTHYTYDVQALYVKNPSATSSSVPSYYAQVLCRTPNGCRVDQGYYDITCPTGCWNGLLSWWYK